MTTEEKTIETNDAIKHAPYEQNWFDLDVCCEPGKARSAKSDDEEEDDDKKGDEREPVKETRVLVQLLSAAVSSIETSPAEQARISSIIADLERYTGQPITATSAPDLMVYERFEETNDLKYNVCYSVVSTIVSRICSFRPRAQFVPDASDYKTQRLTRDLTAGMDAWAKREQYQEEASAAFRDCLTGPGGVLKVYQEDDRVRLGRFPSWEFKVDEEDGKYGEPECIYHVRWITQTAALKQYGQTAEARAAIVEGTTRLASTEGYSKIGQRGGKAMTRVVDAYKRGPVGRHVLMAGDHVAVNQPWKHERHPVEVLRFDKASSGFWGRSAIAPIRSIQDRIDDNLGQIDEAHHMSNKLVIAAEEGTIVPESMTNEPVLMVTHKPGKSVTFANPRAVDPGSYEWWNIIKTMAFEILGVSPNSAQATKPPAVTAAVAIDALTDVQTDRLSQLSQMWEQLCPRVADLWYAISSDMGAGGEEYLAIDRGASRVIKFAEAGNKPAIDTFPTSLFGTSPSHQLQKGMDMVKAGYFSEEELFYILDIPDLGPATKLKLAEFFYVESLVDRILTEGEKGYETPDPWADPVKLFEYARRRYLAARTPPSNYPKEHLAEMRKLLDYIQPIAQAAKDKAQGKPPGTAQPAATPLPVAAPPSPLPPGGSPLIQAPPAAPPPPLPGLPQSPETALAAPIQ